MWSQIKTAVWEKTYRRTYETCILGIGLNLHSASPAFANDCPNQIKNLEAMAKMMPGDAATMKKVLALIDLAKTEHENGDLASPLEDVKEANKLLGI